MNFDYLKRELPVEVKKYLLKKSFIEKWMPYLKNNKLFNFVVVVPAIAELENLKKLLTSLSKNRKELFGKFLILVVVNNTGENTEEVKKENLKTIDFIKELIAADRKIFNGLNIGLIDAASKANEMPPKIGGVGLARKIGCDAALTLLNYNNINGIAWLDADCITDNNYFEEIEKFFKKENKAGYFKFQHLLTTDKVVNKSIVQYELFLHYYVLGLRYALSPFAFHTIGSTILFSPEVYLKIGGMNLRKAGEDFYFLEKISKIENIEIIATAKVYPMARPSWRVPFGTGRTLQKFIDSPQFRQLFYSPESFKILRQWNSIFLQKNFLSSEDYLFYAASISEELRLFLELNKFKTWWGKIISNSTEPEIILKQKKFWFDGFRTLKLFHYLRESKFPDVGLSEAFEGLKLLNNKLPITLEGVNLLTFWEQIKLLDEVREIVFLK